MTSCSSFGDAITHYWQTANEAMQVVQLSGPLKPSFDHSVSVPAPHPTAFREFVIRPRPRPDPFNVLTSANLALCHLMFQQRCLLLPFMARFANSDVQAVPSWPAVS